MPAATSDPWAIVRAGIDAAARLGSAEDLDAIREALTAGPCSPGASALVDLVDVELDQEKRDAAELRDLGRGEP